ncbi:MAG: HD-GYP domain-containing protein [Treponema sp.]|nr:HD-GYP domain-containing protein [Treponema sp.]MCL2271461.1 HD-GYP domain-containing protein [Treponema sp.]
MNSKSEKNKKEKTTDNKSREAENFYTSFLKFTQCVFTGIGALDIDTIAKEIIKLRHEIQYNCRFLLYAGSCIESVNNGNYLASHAVRSTVTAMIIGKSLKMPPHQLLELGIAAFLHDIGMLMLPSETYLSESELKAKEKELINSHPMHGFNVLKSFNCSPVVSSAVLEHHERENGSGYPRKLKGDNISLYGKIIAVSCSYEALCAKRSYKKMKDQHSGIVELLKNEGNQYDIKIVRALVAALSIFPIGTPVLLSNGKQGRVYDINPVNNHYPIVQVDEDKIIRTSCNDVSIVRYFTQEEIDRKKQGWYSAEEYIMKHRPAS